MSTALNISVQLKPFKDLEVSKIMCETVDLPLKFSREQSTQIGSTLENDLFLLSQFALRKNLKLFIQIPENAPAANSRLFQLC